MNGEEVRSLFLFSRLWNLDAGRRKWAKAMTKVSRADSPVPPYLTAADGRICRCGSKSIALNAVDTAVPACWAPRSWEPAHARSNCSGAITKATQARCSGRPVTQRLPAPFRLPEGPALKDAPTPRVSGHVTHD